MNLLATPRGRRALFAALYLSEGAPIGFVWWALPTRLRAAGVDVEAIATLAALLAVPWALKFLWAPLVDALRGPRWPLRSWIAAAQVVMVLTLLPLATVDPVEDFALLVGLLVVHAVAAATQDVAVDALCIAATRPGERGALNGWMQAGMLAGRAVFGGGALVVGARLGDAAVVLLLAGVVAGVLVLVLVAVPRQAESGERPAGAAGLGHALGAAAARPSTWFALLFAGVAGAGFEAVGAVAGPYLIDRGLGTEAVGTFFAVPAVGGMVVGALVGGRVADAFGGRRAVALFQALMVAAVLAVAAVDGRGPAATLAALGAFYVAIGLFTAASYALLMDLCTPRLAATQFSAYMGATNACESWAAFTVGKLIPRLGYPAAFVAMAAVSLASLPLVRRLRDGAADSA